MREEIELITAVYWRSHYIQDSYQTQEETTSLCIGTTVEATYTMYVQ